MPISKEDMDQMQNISKNLHDVADNIGTITSVIDVRGMARVLDMYAEILKSIATRQSPPGR